ncbi:MAG: type IV pilus modification PilV family protein [Opitutales bacterium]
MKLKFPQSCGARRCGFTLIEVVLALGVFLVSVMALVGLLAPMLQSIDEIEKMDEINSVVNTVDAFLQGSPDIAVRNGATIVKTKFDAIYDAVYNGSEATLFIYRYYQELTDGSQLIRLETGFSPAEEAYVGEASLVNKPDSNPATFALAAGPIYRVVLSASPVTPLPLRSVDRDTTTGIYALEQPLASYPEGYLALEARIFAEDPPGPGGTFETVTNLENLLLVEPDFTFNTAIVR